MKLITLLTTLIITLASSNVFAKTFVCENWKWLVTKDELVNHMRNKMQEMLDSNQL